MKTGLINLQAQKKPSETLQNAKLIYRVCFIPKIDNIGGPSTFQKKLFNSLQKRGIPTSYTGTTFEKFDVILLINATKLIHKLSFAKLRGARIIQRLGLPFHPNIWLNMNKGERIRSLISTVNQRMTRELFADMIVYQSKYVQKCWNMLYGQSYKKSYVIYNGIDLSFFNPIGEKYIPKGEMCVVSVEGTQPNPTESLAFNVVKELIVRGVKTELLVFGRASNDTRMQYSKYSFVRFMGQVPNNVLPFYLRSAHVFLSNDYIAACPNSVLEALACGTPIVGYKLGVLPELLKGTAGKCVHSGGAPWKYRKPNNISFLADAAIEIYEKYDQYSRSARRLAEEHYGLDHMVDQYIQIFEVR